MKTKEELDNEKNPDTEWIWTYDLGSYRRKKVKFVWWKFWTWFY
jgi:hypothetical protein